MSDAEIVGNWKANDQATQEFNASRGLDQFNLQLMASLADQAFPITTFTLDGRCYKQFGRRKPLEFSVSKLTRDKDTVRITLTSIHPGQAPIAEEWQVISANRVAKLYGHSRIWLVHERIRTDEVPSIDPRTTSNGTDDFLSALIESAEVVSEKERQLLLSRPPSKWTTSESEPADQMIDFIKWGLANEVDSDAVDAISDWLLQGDTDIKTEILNNLSGDKYRVAGQKGSWGANCSIYFIGNANWPQP
ncbi:MAG: hypothetical protein U0795_08020 [Pirellulales bacterium]